DRCGPLYPRILDEWFAGRGVGAFLTTRLRGAWNAIGYHARRILGVPNEMAGKDPATLARKSCSAARAPRSVFDRDAGQV
ncbi:hypothetical protein, partial [Nitrobacter sp. 62-13]|uniref:hypothetical protein n=1 Tax=Nitrobacter sp. 62-13 TaxID=1895797 RepID=UPI0025FC7462